jgi:hypothetical protein
MPITSRPATLADIDRCLSIQPLYLGDALVGRRAAVDAWKHLARDGFSASTVLESTSLPLSDRIVGFGASVFLSSAFLSAELASPRPDINSRIIASVHSGRSVLATHDEIARGNAGVGIDVLVLVGTWRDEILSQQERQEARVNLASGFVQKHSGYRIRRVFTEVAAQPERDFVEQSIEYRLLGAFPESRRALFLMTEESVQGIHGSLGNLLFKRYKPVLHLRESDQQLLLAAMGGATDLELVSQIGVTLSGVKARWRSAFARIAETMPELIPDLNDHQGRGMQKRHRVLDYVRNHLEELRPYDWEQRTANPKLGDLPSSVSSNYRLKHCENGKRCVRD